MCEFWVEILWDSLAEPKQKLDDLEKENAVRDVTRLKRAAVEDAKLETKKNSPSLSIFDTVINNYFGQFELLSSQSSLFIKVWRL